MANYPPLSLSSKMPFGKYKGDTIRSIIKNNPGYIDWLVNNTSVRINFDEQNQEDELEEYLSAHPNPYGLNSYELRIAVLASLCIVRKQGEPGLDDWDDTQYARPDHSSYYGSVY